MHVVPCSSVFYCRFPSNSAEIEIYHKQLCSILCQSRPICSGTDLLGSPRTSWLSFQHHRLCHQTPSRIQLTLCHFWHRSLPLNISHLGHGWSWFWNLSHVSTGLQHMVTQNSDPPLIQVHAGVTNNDTSFLYLLLLLLDTFSRTFISSLDSINSTTFTNFSSPSAQFISQSYKLHQLHHFLQPHQPYQPHQLRRTRLYPINSNPSNNDLINRSGNVLNNNQQQKLEFSVSTRILPF